MCVGVLTISQPKMWRRRKIKWKMKAQFYGGCVGWLITLTYTNRLAGQTPYQKDTPVYSSIIIKVYILRAVYIWIWQVCNVLAHRRTFSYVKRVTQKHGQIFAAKFISLRAQKQACAMREMTLLSELDHEKIIHFNVAFEKRRVVVIINELYPFPLINYPF